jgi:hypothetical protein
MQDEAQSDCFAAVANLGYSYILVLQVVDSCSNYAHFAVGFNT